MTRKTKPKSLASLSIRRAQKAARRAARAGKSGKANAFACAALSLAAQARRIETAARIGVVAPARIGPVLLDPKGCSPSGIPNWFLNKQRLERAGIRTKPPQA
jgi:hypothetical protein